MGKFNVCIRKSEERGYFDHGWLKTHHTFSFSDYYDLNFMGFRALRVINEDWIEKGVGFPTHPHRDMEIITYVMSGTLAHKDSMGNGSSIPAGDIQYMSAGKGVTHSEFNHSKTEDIHLFQIWILPDEKSAEPRYAQNSISREEKLNKLRLLASKAGEQDSIAIRQDVNLYAAILESGQKITYKQLKGRYTWIQVARGELKLNGLTLKNGDGAAIDISLETNLGLELAAGTEETEFLLFDLS